MPVFFAETKRIPSVGRDPLFLYPMGRKEADMWIKFNANPGGLRVGDCTIRAICKATNKGWEEIYTGVALQGFTMHDMPTANHVWGAYLKSQGFQRRTLPPTCPDCYTVEKFAEDHPAGIYILALSGHVVCVQDGNWYDTWNSGDEVPLYYWERS